MESEDKVGYFSARKTDVRSTLTERINSLHDALDLPDRNPLLSFQHAGRKSLCVRLIDVLPDALFASLCDFGRVALEPLAEDDAPCEDEQTLEFRLALARARITDADYLSELDGLGPYERDEERTVCIDRMLRDRVRQRLQLPQRSLDCFEITHGDRFDWRFELPWASRGRPAYQITAVRTPYTPGRLQDRLCTLYCQHRTVIAETGRHDLHVAFGFVGWGPGKIAGAHAPLLLMPIQLDRRRFGCGHDYSIYGLEEELLVNPALQEKLWRDFGIQLPTLLAEDTPDTYSLRTLEALQKCAPLSFKRMATIAPIPLSRSLIARDLKHSPTGHLKLKFGAKGQKDLTRTKKHVPSHSGSPLALIYPADSQQQAAIRDIKSGESISLEAPIGSNKAECIANIVASAVDENKHVLYVAEKRSALASLATKLRQRGFGPLLLEVHSDRTTKWDVLNSLRERLDADLTSGAVDISASRAQVQNVYETLGRHSALLSRRVGSLPLTLNQLIWNQILLERILQHQLPQQAWKRTIEDASYVTEQLLVERCATLDSVEASAKGIEARCGRLSDCLWFGSTIPADQKGLESLRRLLEKALSSVSKLNSAVQSSSSAKPADSLRELEIWAWAAARMPSPDTSVAPEILRVALSQNYDLMQFRNLLHMYWSKFQAVSEFHPEPAEADLVACRQFSAAVAALSTPELNLIQLDEARHDCRQTLTFLRSLERQVEPTISEFGVKLETSQVKAVETLLHALSSIASLPEETLALRSTPLLDPDVELLIRNVAAEASTILSNEDRLSSEVDLDAARALGYAQLDSLATTMEASGIARIVIPNRRTAVQKATSVLRSKRWRHAKKLAKIKEVVAFLIVENDFANSDRIARLFGDQWKGHRSDFIGLLQMRMVLVEAANLLSEAGCSGLIKFIANESISSIREVGSFCSLSSGDKKILDMFPNSLFGEAIRKLEEKVELYAEAGETARRASIKATAKLSSAAKFGELVESFQSTFRELRTTIAAKPTWTWFTGAEGDEEKIAIALRAAAGMTSVGAPIEMVQHIIEADHPCEAVARLRRNGQDVLKRLGQFKQVANKLCTAMGTTPARFLRSAEIDDLTLDVLAQQLSAALVDRDGMQNWAELVNHLRAAERQGARFVFDIMVERGGQIARLATIYKSYLIRSLVSKALGSEEFSGLLCGAALAEYQSRLCELESKLNGLEATRIVNSRLRDKAPLGAFYGPESKRTQLSLIKSEISKGRHHISMGALLGRATDAMQALKPIWLMSPAALDAIVPPEPGLFDLVVIDGASQMLAEHAIGALSRATQVVAIRDGIRLGGVEKNASLEDKISVALPNRHRLKALYSCYPQARDNDLSSQTIPFPLSGGADPMIGRRCHFLSGICDDGINESETKAVIESVVYLVRTYPHLSIGVITMTPKQADLLNAEISCMAEIDEDFDSYLEEKYEKGVPFFVKDLRSFGPEARDVMIVSTVHSTMAETAQLFDSFGPNAATCLKSLFSRPTTLVFTSLRAADIEVSDSSSEAVCAFKTFVSYPAEVSSLEQSKRRPQSDFELVIADVLREAGYGLIFGLGSETSCVQMAVTHPSFAGILAGVECDGVNSETGQNLLDWCWIRKAFMGHLDCKVYQVSTADWIKDPEAESEKLLLWLDQLRSGKTNPKTPHLEPKHEFPDLRENTGNLRECGRMAHA